MAAGEAVAQSSNDGPSWDAIVAASAAIGGVITLAIINALGENKRRKYEIRQSNRQFRLDSCIGLMVELEAYLEIVNNFQAGNEDHEARRSSAANIMQWRAKVVVTSPEPIKGTANTIATKAHHLAWREYGLLGQDQDLVRLRNELVEQVAAEFSAE